LTVSAFAAGSIIPDGSIVCRMAMCSSPKRAHPCGPTISRGFKGDHAIFMKRAGSTPSANRITLLRDADHDGVAEPPFHVARRAQFPFGMTLVGDRLYIADTDAILVFRIGR
jgi:hypothetical protein